MRKRTYNYLAEDLDMKNQEKTQEIILAPRTGTAVAITDVPDPIFTEKILGDGIAIIPTDGK